MWGTCIWNKEQIATESTGLLSSLFLSWLGKHWLTPGVTHLMSLLLWSCSVQAEHFVMDIIRVVLWVTYWLSALPSFIGLHSNSHHGVTGQRAQWCPDCSSGSKHLMSLGWEAAAFIILHTSICAQPAHSAPQPAVAFSTLFNVTHPA